jgi:hypothetical protein
MYNKTILRKLNKCTEIRRRDMSACVWKQNCNLQNKGCLNYQDFLILSSLSYYRTGLALCDTFSLSHKIHFVLTHITSHIYITAMFIIHLLYFVHHQRFINPKHFEHFLYYLYQMKKLYSGVPLHTASLQHSDGQVINIVLHHC